MRIAPAGAALFALASLGCPSAPREVVYDLAERLPYAERWSSREVILFGTPAAEPQLADGFYREAAPAEGDPFVWSRGEAELSLTWPAAAARAAVADLAPYKGVKSQSVEVTLNGTSVSRFTLNDVRHRYLIPLPAAPQRPGENRLRFIFAATASPADLAKDADKRQLAAAFYSLVIGGADDAGLEDLLGRDAPRPFQVTQAAGLPALTEMGPSVARFAVRLPPGAELRLTPELHAAARAAGASASFRVTVEARAGEEKEIWSRVIGPAEREAEEVRLSLPGAAGDIVRLGLHVGPAGATGDRFAWGTWRAPRLMGRAGEGEMLRAPAPSAEEQRKADGLRDALGSVNVLLIVLDAARADHFGCYGYARPTTPNVDRLAREGTVFERVFTPAVYTLGAMSSVWTSQYPDRHHAEVSFAARLPSNRLTLAELLGAQGIHTAGFVSNTVAGSLNGFDRGFAEFHEVWQAQGTSAASGIERVVPPWLAAHRDRRFFAYVHFREPHQPYMPPPPFDTRFGPDAPLAGPLRADPVAQQDWIKDVNQGRRALSAPERDHLVRLYDGNLAFADEVIGKIRAALESSGLLERTVVIVTADHGEALHEHGWIGHNVQLYDESVHVPLVVRFPSGKGPAPARAEGLADLLDVAPTIAHLFGVLGKGGSDRQFQGRSLLLALSGARAASAVVSRTVWDRPRYSRRDADGKFIYDTRTGEAQLYDVARDPGETRDLASSDPLRAAWARETLHHWIAVVARGAAVEGGAGEGPQFTRDQCENLKAMGYISASVDCSRYPAAASAP